MRRLSIEVTPEQHRRLKAIAALQGKSIKDYVLERALPPAPSNSSLSEEEALQQLETLLAPRVEAAERDEISSRTPAQIFEDVRRNLP